MKRESRNSSSGSLFSKQVSERFVSMDDANPRVASAQEGDSSVCYEVSTMKGSGSACAIICVSGLSMFYRTFAFHVDAKIP